MSQVYSSTYRNVVESLRKAIESHPGVKTFRVGPPSSIEMPDNEKPEIKYPYVHLVPVNAVLDGRSTIFDFDMIADERNKSGGENGYEADYDAFNQNSEAVLLCHAECS